MPDELEKDVEIQEFSMYISKASLNKETQEMCWRSVNSDDAPDLYGEQMSLELFNNFVRRIQDGTKIPEPFYSVIAEDGWDGGMPYLSISHYKSASGKNIPGIVKSVYVDGNKLKSAGTLHKNAFGYAVFDSLLKDLYGESDYENKIRISIGFLDLKHSHGDFVFTRSELKQQCPMCIKGEGNKVYLDGQLVHLALTRVPVNPRTSMEVEKSMTTKKEDAESIVGELADTIEEKSQVTDEALVTKNDAVEETPAEVKTDSVSTPAPVEKMMDKKHEKEMDDEMEDEDEMKDKKHKKGMKEEKSALDKSFDTLKSMLAGGASLEDVQAVFNQFGETVKSLVAPEPVQPAPVAPVFDAEALRAIIREELQPVKTEVAVLKAQLEPKGTKPEVPPQRSLVVRSNLLKDPAQQTKKLTRIQELALKSTIG